MEIPHKRGKDNVVVDALSPKDEGVKAYTILVAVQEWLYKIWGEYAKDPDTCALINDPNQGLKLEWRNDILWFKTKVLKESHDSLAVGHVGFFKTYYNARQSFYWKGLYKDIQKYVVDCNTYQRNKSENYMTPRLLHPLHIPS